ncbi:histonelysine Nmethyltransferase SETMARlike [Trichonephila clavipes]|nr:histonelysine Nmethyltransferase SETMARlike [Trichonephila clavipes]
MPFNVNCEAVESYLQFELTEWYRALNVNKAPNDEKTKFLVILMKPHTVRQMSEWWFIFLISIFDVKDAPRTGRPVVDNVDKFIELIEIDGHVSSRSISQEQKIDHKTVLSHLGKVGFKKKLDL